MVEFDLPKQKSSIIKVIGVGGGGSNAVNYMYNHHIEGVDFIICNTDAKALEQSPVPNKIQLGPYLTQGLGAGANPEVGKQAAEESTDEIRKILEVNTKMAFITAGMGGGTGTGGAPIMAKICKEMGILTVGIVTTPFGFEGPRRSAQAEAGIRELEPYVDTLLIISNDKMRMQYGNLKAREAFSKADDVLATAAKCITDIINSRGHIIVDFADVCTVMKNGGVAILGSAEAEGDNRAMDAIENALNSPLLNDSNIRDAKWILLNVNSSEGDYECTMDEIELISEYVRRQSGDHADVIFGMGFDNSLQRKLNITLIATGFQNRNPFDPTQHQAVKPAVEARQEEKVVVTLNMSAATVAHAAPEPMPAPAVDAYAPTMHVSVGQPTIVHEMAAQQAPAPAAEPQRMVLNMEAPAQQTPAPQPATTYAAAAPQTASYLAKPSNVYATAPSPAQPAMAARPAASAQEEPELQLVIKQQAPEAAASPAHAGIGGLEDEDDQVRKARERIARLRQISFNVNGNDVNNEFETVPAYVRKNMELYGNTALAGAENYYSRYAVKNDGRSDAPISTLNSFLEGKKPD